jgi:hypothetical protein
LYQKDSQLYRDVIRAGNLGERTGFLIAAPEIGSSQFPVYDSSVEGSYRSVSILTIGELYFSIISGNQFLGRTDYGFPNNLALNARSEQHKASLASYALWSGLGLRLPTNHTPLNALWKLPTLCCINQLRS